MFRIVLAGLLVMVAGCGILTHDCTLIGCSSGLTVDLQGASEEPFMLTVESKGGEKKSVECASPGSCFAFFEEFTPAEVTVTFESEATRVERTFTPEYSRWRPNGPDCPPECRIATVVLSVS